ncbi:MAG: hypothetical protein V1908_00275 [Candidatus Peregrinibacteria bacterium]
MKPQKTPKQAETNLNALFKKYGIHRKINVEQIKKWIWNEKGKGMEAVNKYNKKCLQLFPEPKDIDEMNDILQIFVDAWNYFPHKELGGRSPNEVLQEEMKKMPKEDREKRDMPKVSVGGMEMEWEEYWQMLKEMEREQKPFKRWIEGDALPKYKKYLEQMVKGEKNREKHYDVAERFFDRVLHVGFLELARIRPAFIQEEFPHWWPTHIMYSNLTPKQVAQSLRILFTFIEFAYKVNMKKYGFGEISLNF